MRRALLIAVPAALLLLLIPAVGIADRGRSDDRATRAERGGTATILAVVVRVEPRKNRLVVRASRGAANGRRLALSVPAGVGLPAVGDTVRVTVRGRRSRATLVSIAVVERGTAIRSRSDSSDDTAEPFDDEIEVKGILRSTSPVVVETTAGSVTCFVPTGAGPAGFAPGDLVELTCDLIGGQWVVREIHHEDDVDDDDDDDDHGDVDDDDDDDDDDDSGHDDDGDDD